MYDVVIIGAGVSGSSVARELSRYQAKICILEREDDVCCGSSKANSGIVHAGYDAVPGTLKAKMNILGNQLMEPLSKELDFPFKKNGSLVLCQHEEDLPHLQELYERGIKNGVTGMKILAKEEVTELEPNISEQVVAALYAPSGGIVCPFLLTIAMAENACTNGVEFRFQTEVSAIQKEEQCFKIQTSRGEVYSRCIVNAAGVYADQIHNMVSEQKLSITARRGEYYLLDHTAGHHVEHTIFMLPGKLGKGVLVAPTVHENLIVGPNANEVMDKEAVNTTAEGLQEVAEKAGHNVRNLPIRQVITSFAGLRAHESDDDFVIGEVSDAEGFFDCAGIESPGLTSAPAIGQVLAEQIKEKLGLTLKPDFHGERKGILNPNNLSLEERNQLIQKNPAYGTIICRCEMITEGEIIDAIHRPLGARSLDAVKRRTRAGMGRCQSGFCMPKVTEILARECGLSLSEITKSGYGSNLITGKPKQPMKEGI